MKITGKFVQEKETPNTIRFMEVDDEGMKIGPGAAIGTIYISKSALPRPFPQALTVVVEA